MTTADVIALWIIISSIWLGWPLYSISASLAKLLRMAEKQK